MLPGLFDILGNIFISAGLLFIVFGVIGIYRFKDFYARILISSKVDTIGFITIMFGVILKAGFSMFSLKVILILIISIIINPIVSNAVVRSAYYSDYRIERKNSG